MAHELTIRESGKVEMAYTGETPWHGLGSQLEPGLPIEAWIEAAGMDWKIQRGRVRYAVAHGSTPDAYKEFDDRVVLFRSDDKAPLGIVSDGFNIVQPRAVLEFFRDLTESAGLTLNTAGTLFGGRKFWAMATLGKGASIGDKRDVVKQNLLLATACDGTMATYASWIAKRVVCNNTLQIGLRETDALRVKINHKSQFRADQVKADLGIEQAQSVFARTVVEMRKLAALRIAPAVVVAKTAELFTPAGKTFGEMSFDDQNKLLKSKPVETVGRLALDGAAIGASLDGAQGTAFGWLNAVTQYIDHDGRARTADNRLDSAWFGRGAALKDRAYEMALSIGRDDGDGELMTRAKPLSAINAWLDSHGGRTSDIA